MHEVTITSLDDVEECGLATTLNISRWTRHQGPAVFLVFLLYQRSRAHDRCFRSVFHAELPAGFTKETRRNRSVQLMERDQFITRLRDALQGEREKTSKLQSRSNQQALELKRREQLINRMKEKLSQFTDRHRGLSIETINAHPKLLGQREPVSRRAQSDGRKEEALRLMLERREAELREAMKLRHSLTTLLHALRTDMQQTLEEVVNTEEEEEEKTATSRLVQSEQSLGDHVTGGVFLEWTHVQKRMRELQAQSV
ncbi:afadin- and alpha-actinin-binding protein-like [Tachysurus fulvidraco]|uniref:afadin- and alpha-actinin-binding protein-like n=1 Tax=Tachysurus fulvidraco TaxID=1234273 RepID=UPI001FEEE353|nr:afadin- and alpha-actinin-binding protein-like [Tachysurus fulvidraco]